jgi:hypothetical protein
VVSVGGLRGAHGGRGATAVAHARRSGGVDGRGGGVEVPATILQRAAGIGGGRCSDALDGLGRHGCCGDVEGQVHGEVEVGGGALEADQRGVVGARGGLGGGVGAEPYPRLLVGRPDLRHPRPPAPHPHALVLPRPPALMLLLLPRRSRIAGGLRLQLRVVLHHDVVAASSERCCRCSFPSLTREMSEVMVRSATSSMLNRASSSC